MKIDDTIFDKIVDAVNSALQFFHSHKSPARRYVRRYRTRYNDADREFILKEILHSQNRSVANAIGNKKNIAIPVIGSFQYRETLEATKEIKREVKEKYHITNMKEVDPVIFDAILKEIDTKKRDIILPLYFKGVGGKGSTVNPNFRNKE